jgi:HD-like signal output (HDOD) protein
MKRIMFVDDEAAVLGALSNLLRRERHRWDLVFANGGAEALIELDREPFDIVITDMRMPEIDGLDVLAAVKAKSPRTIRIILSGYAESSLVLQALPLVHQFLSKPCDAKTLRGVIDRCGNDAVLTGLVGSLPCVPSLPAILDELHHATRNPSVTIGKLTKICERDPGLAAKVLQIANTAHFRGGDEPTSSIHTAVSILGSDTMAALATSSMIAVPANPISQALIGQLQQQAVEAAQHARRSMTDRARTDDAYTAGLLHDIGRLVLADVLGERYLPVLRAAETAPLSDCERELLGVTHQAVGASLLALWGLPPGLVEAVQAAATDPESSAASRVAS